MDDIIEVETKAGEVRGPSLHLEQIIRRGEEVLTTAKVLVVCIRNGRPQRLPESLRIVLSKA
jgi:acyl-CoA thioester hydrolase